MHSKRRQAGGIPEWNRIVMNCRLVRLTVVKYLESVPAPEKGALVADASSPSFWFLTKVGYLFFYEYNTLINTEDIEPPPPKSKCGQQLQCHLWSGHVLCNVPHNIFGVFCISAGLPFFLSSKSCVVRFPRRGIHSMYGVVPVLVLRTNKCLASRGKRRKKEITTKR